MERPILMSIPMVQAILDGRKTQTRRIVKGQPLDWLVNAGFTAEYVSMPENHLYPYGKPGDILWVRETFYAYGYWITIRDNKTKKEEWHFQDMTIDNGYKHRFFDNEPEEVIKGRFGYGWYKRPSIFMPKEACRIKILVKDIRVERLQDISEQDAIAEGCEKAIKWIHTGKIEVIDQSHVFYHHSTYKQGYEMLWESINGEGSWEKNPFVWVITFKRIK